MSLIQFLFGFHGRIGRLHLWLYLLVVALVQGGLWWQCGYYPGAGYDDDLLPGALTDSYDVRIWSSHFDGLHIVTHNPLAALAGGLWLWTWLAVFVKRWHDRDKSGAWMLINLIPVIGWIWTLVECGGMAGTPGYNRYGGAPEVFDEDAEAL